MAISEKGLKVDEIACRQFLTIYLALVLLKYFLGIGNNNLVKNI